MAEVCHYLRAYPALPADAPHHSEFRVFEDLSAMRLVFESNLIESAGLSEGDTRKVIAEFFPEVPSTYEAFRSLHGAVPIPMHRGIAESIIEDRRPDLLPSYQFKNKSRSVREVLQHYLAYQQCRHVSLAYQIALLVAPHDRAQAVDCDDSIRAQIDRSPPSLITEAAIKWLHATMARDLLPEDSKVGAGEYRIDARSVGLDVGFPAPELVPSAMKAFEQRSEQTLTSKLHPISKAASITYDFLMIHPFPDFNGRISRLLLAMILHTEGVPFPVALKGDKKWKGRYLYSLRRANPPRNDLRPYETLIARRLVESFQEVDRNVVAAGLPALLSFASAR